jgi:hypothetical protein
MCDRGGSLDLMACWRRQARLDRLRRVRSPRERCAVDGADLSLAAPGEPIQALAWLTAVFGRRERVRMAEPDGR